MFFFVKRYLEFLFLQKEVFKPVGHCFQTLTFLKEKFLNLIQNEEKQNFKAELKLVLELHV